MKKIISIILVVMSLGYLNGQVNSMVANNLQEKIYVHTDNNFYTTGEIIWFAIYIFDAEDLKPFDGSKTAYLELISPDSESIIQQKVELDSARGSGSVYLPLDLISGNYTLKVYTAWMKNFKPESYYSQPITIINPFEKLHPSQISLNNDTIENSSVKVPGNYHASHSRIKKIQISSNKNKYNKREKVTLTLKSDDKKSGYYSIVVYRVDSLSQFEHPDIVQTLFSGTNAEKSTTEFTMNYIPEIEGQILKFKITDDDKKPISGEKAYLSIPGNNFRFYSTVSDESGYLKFTTDHFYGNKEIAINLENDSAYSFEYISPFEGNFKTNSVGLKLNKKHLTALQERSLNMQVQNVFAKDELIKTREIPDLLPFYGKADKTYLLDDYTRFPTMQEVMIEFISEVRLKQNNRNFKLRVYEIPYSRFFEGEPLLLINGLPVKNANTLMQTDPLQIKKIDIVARKFLYGNSYFEGIINLVTYPYIQMNKLLEEVNFRKEIEGYSYNRIFYSLEHEEVENPNIPDYRQLLYWNATLKIKENARVEFFTADRIAKYKVVLQGVDTNGNFSSSNYFFEVVE